jgi:hypothetical protein
MAGWVLIVALAAGGLPVAAGLVALLVWWVRRSSRD